MPKIVNEPSRTRPYNLALRPMSGLEDYITRCTEGSVSVTQHCNVISSAATSNTVESVFNMVKKQWGSFWPKEAKPCVQG